MPDGHIAGPLPAASLAVASPAPAPHVERPVLDRVGIGVSLTCAIHCIATALLGVVPALAGRLAILESIELPMLVAALVVGIASLVPAARAHHHRGPLGLFSAGMLLLIASRFVPEGAPELILTVGGFTPVALAHVWNLRLCRH
jgi:hypothetical protein